MVARTVGLREVWYFGLRYVDDKEFVSWLRTDKKVVSYCHNNNNYYINVLSLWINLYQKNNRMCFSSGPSFILRMFQMSWYNR